MDISKDDIELCLREHDYRKFVEFCYDNGLDPIIDKEDNDYFYLVNEDYERSERIFLYNIDLFSLLNQFHSLMYDYMFLKRKYEENQEVKKKKSEKQSKYMKFN